MDRIPGAVTPRQGGARGGDDAVLVAAACDDDQAAWAELHRRHHHRLVAIARGRGLDGSDAADAAQRAWALLHRHIGGLREPEKVFGWLAVTVRHEAGRVPRRREVATDPTVIARAERPGDGAPDPAERVVAAEERRVVHLAFRRLPARCQELFRLLEWEGLSYEEAAARLGMKIGSVGPTRQRCLACLARETGVDTRRSA